MTDTPRSSPDTECAGLRGAKVIGDRRTASLLDFSWSRRQPAMSTQKRPNCSPALHTPGPWEYVPSTEHHGPYVTSDYGTTICDCYVMSQPGMWSTASGGESKPVHHLHEMADPNARLIAAAPEVLTELLDCPCPQPANSAPDDLTVKDCLDRDECGCGRGHAAAKALGIKTACQRWNEQQSASLADADAAQPGAPSRMHVQNQEK